MLNPVFSPDGESIAFVSNIGTYALKKIAAGGGVGREHLSLSPVHVDGMSWGADGILFGQGPVASCGWPTPAARRRCSWASAGRSGHGPQMLPDGESPLHASDGPARSGTRPHCRAVAPSGERKTLVEGASDGRYLPTGHLVYAIGGTLFAAPFDLSRLEVAP